MVQTISSPAKVRSFGELCVEDVVQRKEHSFGNRGIRFRKNYLRVFQKDEIALAEAATHSCKLIPNRTWNRLITYTHLDVKNYFKSFGIYIVRTVYALNWHEPVRNPIEKNNLFASCFDVLDETSNGLIQKLDGNVRWRWEGARNSLDSVLIWPYLDICTPSAVVKWRTCSYAESALFGQFTSLGSLSKHDVGGSANVIWKCNFCVSAIIFQLCKVIKLEKCVLTVLELNWNQRLGHKKTKLNICHHVLTSSTQLQNRSFHVVERTRTSSKCQKMKNTRAKRAKILFSIVKYANLSGFCCRRRLGCLSSLLFHGRRQAKMKYARAGRAARAKILFLLIKYANLWRPVCRRHAIVWKSLVPCD